MLNLAATLGTPAVDEFDVDQSRARLQDDLDQARLELSQERLRLLERQRDEHDHRDRLLRAMNRLNRMSDNSAAYGDRVPSQNSLYDWSPANEADDEDELDQILAELRREQPNTHPEILRVLGQSQLDSERARIRSLTSRAQNPSSSSEVAREALRSTAILHSMRRHPRFSARTRDYLQRYQSDREAAAARATPRNESQELPASESAARQMAMQRLSEGRTSLDRERRDMLSRADSYRRGYLDRSTNATPTVSPMLEQTVKYLSRIRHSSTIDESLHCALEAGFMSKDYSCMQRISSPDFVTDTFSIPPPTETSWLAPGAVLSGCQHATSVATTVTAAAPGTNTALHRFRILDGTTNPTLPALPPPTRPWISSPYSTTRSPSQRLPEAQPSQPSQQDRWPVKVTIHAVDWEKFTLSATMEAYNVPSHPHTHQNILNVNNTNTSPTSRFTRTSSITTYLEGEILDLNNHTLLTESFKSTAINDATYWRKLPPFQKMSDEEIVQALTSKKWFTDVLSKEWILMRWKERCFVKSLNRSTPDPTNSSTQPSADASGPYSSMHTSPTAPIPYYPSAAAQVQPSPYRIVRNAQTGRAEVEISPLFDAIASSDAEHATFDDSGCGLTISGFYYVCLRRSDGVLEGLYYDPQSSPYQCLKLESVRGGMVPAWGFR